MKKMITYVFPVYNEGEGIDVFYKAVNAALRTHKQYIYELLFVNDGSSDESLEKLVALQERDKRITVINFSRNFGHQMAVTAGLDYAHGDAVIIMDSDLQDPPHVSFELIQKWEEGYEVVYAQRRTRQDSAFKRLTAYYFYKLLERLAEIKIPPNTGDFRLLDRKVVQSLSTFKERNRMLRGLACYVGFKQTAVLFDRDKRFAGTSNYTLAKMIKLAADGIFGFSSAPLRLISHLGVFISGISFLGILYALFVRIFRPETVVQGWTFTIVVVLFIGGIQLIVMGVLGSYVGRIYTEIQQRPLYIVSSVYSSSRTNNERKK